MTLGDVESGILVGSEDPIGGWVSYGYPIRQPIPQLRLTKHGKAPQRFVTVIAPAQSNVSGEIKGQQVLLQLGEKQIALLPESVEIQ